MNKAVKKLIEKEIEGTKEIIKFLDNQIKKNTKELNTWTESKAVMNKHLTDLQEEL